MDCRLAKKRYWDSLTNFGNKTYNGGGICSQ